MENEKVIDFTMFRYHLLPLGDDIQLNLFGGKKLSDEEIKKRKNEFFYVAMQSMLTSLDRSHPLQVIHSDENHFLFKLAQKKLTTLTTDFKEKEVPNEPYVFIIINNDPTVQKIAISHNPEAFSNPTVVKNLLKRTLKRDLKEYGLNIEIEQLYDSQEFWALASKYKYDLKYIDFTYIKPNLANISGALPEAFKDFASGVNSHESHLTIKAPENGVLNHIDKNNKDLNGLVKYTSEGAGKVKMKIKGVRKMKQTSEHPIIVSMKEIDLEGSLDQLIKLYQTIIED